MRLTFPPSHRTEDLRPLFEQYKDMFPEIYGTWCSIEEKGRGINPDELKEIQQHVYSFLRERMDYDGSGALVGGFFSFRKILVKDHLGYSLVPGEN